MYQLLDYQKVFAEFTDREAALAQVTRYKMYKPMYYRSNLVTHAKHVFWLVESMLPLAYKVFGDNFDGVKAQLMAAVHDDPETIMGDVEAGIKRKMTPEQLAELDQVELRAIDELAARSPKTILGYSYADLMREAVGLETLEAKIGKFADRFDAHGESLHEIFAGNRAFITPVVNEWGTIDLPAPFYVRYMSEFKQKHPEFEAFYQSDHPMFAEPAAIDYQQVVANGAPHTPRSLTSTTAYPYYNFWKRVILSSDDKDEIAMLTTKKE